MFDCTTPEDDQKIYDALHTPVAYIIGGPDDVAYPQAEDDFAAINNVPFFYGNSPVGHTGTYAQDNGGAAMAVGPLFVVGDGAQWLERRRSSAGTAPADNRSLRGRRWGGY